MRPRTNLERERSLRRSRSSWWPLLAGLFAVLVLSSCSGSDGESGSEDARSTTTSGLTDGGEEREQVDPEELARAERAHGGTMVYGIESDTNDAWAPYRAACGMACRQVLRAISDPLFVTADDGTLAPYLLEAYEPNEDATVWTLLVRDGIEFHDGTPLDGEAVKVNIDACRLAPRTGVALSFLAGVEADGQEVRLTYAAPQASPVAMLRDNVCGYMFSPTWLRQQPDYPMRALARSHPAYDSEARSVEPNDDAVGAPVGLGPFRFESYEPGEGNRFVAERNHAYWRGGGPESLTDEDLPYLDRIEFVVLENPADRVAQLDDGSIDIARTTDNETIAAYEERGPAVNLVVDATFGETNHYLINLASGGMDPEGTNADNPLRVRACRRALAHAIDREALALELGAGVAEMAQGPFGTFVLGETTRSSYPTADDQLAADEMATCLREVRDDTLRIEVLSSSDPMSGRIDELVFASWRSVHGDSIDIDVDDVSDEEFARRVNLGEYEIVSWRNHGGVEPAEQFHWWLSDASAPIGEAASNFGRLRDPALDAEIRTMMTSADPATAIEAAHDITRIFGDEAYLLWTSRTVAAVISTPRVRDLATLRIPISKRAFPVVDGSHHLTEIWCVEGDCQG